MSSATSARRRRLTHLIRLVLLTSLGLLSAAGCNDFSNRWELDHTRILAIQAGAPSLAATERTNLRALVVNDDGEVSEMTPVAALVASMDPMVTAAVTVQAGTWEIIAGNAQAIDAARSKLQVPADQPLVVQIGARFEINGETRDAVKAIRLGVTGLANPAAPSILWDGMPAPPTYAPGAKLELAVANPATDDSLGYQWATSLGEVTKSETPVAKVELAADQAPGKLTAVVIVRDKTGGVAWAQSSATVQAP